MTTWIRLTTADGCGRCATMIPADTVCLATTLAGVDGHRLRCAACAAPDYGPAPEIVALPPAPEPLLPREPPAWVRLNELRRPSAVVNALEEFRKRQAGDDA